MSHPLTSTLIASIMYQLDIASLWYGEVAIGQSCLHVLLTNRLAGTGHGRVKPEAMHPPGFGKLGCIQKIEASAGQCTCGYMCLWLHWCSASAAVGWMLQPRSRWSTQQLGQLTLGTLHCTWQLGKALNQTSNSSPWELVIKLWWIYYCATITSLFSILIICSRHYHKKLKLQHLILFWPLEGSENKL